MSLQRPSADDKEDDEVEVLIYCQPVFYDNKPSLSQSLQQGLQPIPSSIAHKVATFCTSPPPLRSRRSATGKSTIGHSTPDKRRVLATLSIKPYVTLANRPGLLTLAKTLDDTEGADSFQSSKGQAEYAERALASHYRLSLLLLTLRGCIIATAQTQVQTSTRRLRGWDAFVPAGASSYRFASSRLVTLFFLERPYEPIRGYNDIDWR